MPGVLEGIGSIAGNFAQGYRQARAQKTQESLQQQQAQYEHADRLFKMADMVQDPKMKDTLFSSATQILDSLDSPTKTKSNPKGIGAMFGSMFGIGHQKPQDTPAAGMANQPLGPPNPNQPGAPEANPDSQTFGNLGDMFGSALQSKAAAPASIGPVIPPVPQVDMSGVPSSKEIQGSVVPFQPPSFTSPRGTPVAPPVATPQAPAGPAAAPRHPQSGQPLNIPAPIDIQQKAIQATSSPQYGFRDPYKQKIAEQQYASQIMDTLLNVTDQHLAQNPQIKTLAAADNDPDFGPEFRQVMDALGRYEAAGIIEKGTLENWQKQRFEDVRFGSKYNPNPETHTIADAFGNRWKEGPDGKMVPALPDAATKKAEPLTLKQAADAAFLVPEPQRTATDLGTIKSYFDEMSRADRAKLSPTDQVQWDWLKANETMPIQKKAETFQGLFHPVQLGLPVVFNSTNPVTNRTEPSLLNRGTAGITPIPGAQGPGKTFNAEQYMRPYQPPAVKNAAGRMETPPATKLYDPDQLINSHRGGDEAVSVDTLRDLIKDPTKFPPGGVKQIEDYISSLPGPYPVLGQKK